MPSNQPDASQPSPEDAAVKIPSFEDFLALTPPGIAQDVFIWPANPEVDDGRFQILPVSLFCERKECEKETFFDL